MSPGAQARYVLFLTILLILQAVFLFWNGRLMINLHEGDAMHMVQILMRMDAGEVPHRDFLTPIGVLAFLPILPFMGMGVGRAFLAGNVLMAAAMIPALWWLARTRLPGALAYGFGAGVVVLLTAMVHGGTLQVSSVSMYYNRWAWAVAFVAVLAAVLPVGPGIRRHQLADGVLLGLALAALAMLKATYFVALVGPLALALVLRGAWRSLAAGLATGLAVALGVALVWGPEFWIAYAQDLLAVAKDTGRPYPSQPLGNLLTGPRFLLANAVGVAAVILLRQAGRRVEGAVLLLLLPAFVYITWQNWGNDPQWLFVLGVMLLALRPARAVLSAAGWDLRAGLGVLAALSLAMIAPSAVNLAVSASRYARLDPARFTPLLPDPRHASLVFDTKMLYAAEIRTPRPVPDPALARLGASADTRKGARLNGEALPWCKLHRGLGGMMQGFARDLARNVPETDGSSVFVADLLSNLWLFGPTRPVPGGSPWYYGGDAGLSRADYLLVPFCPSSPRIWRQILERLERPGAPRFAEIRRTGDYILLRRLPDGG